MSLRSTSEIDLFPMHQRTLEKYRFGIMGCFCHHVERKKKKRETESVSVYVLPFLSVHHTKAYLSSLSLSTSGKCVSQKTYVNAIRVKMYQAFQEAPYVEMLKYANTALNFMYLNDSYFSTFVSIIGKKKKIRGVRILNSEKILLKTSFYYHWIFVFMLKWIKVSGNDSRQNRFTPSKVELSFTRFHHKIMFASLLLYYLAI